MQRRRAPPRIRAPRRICDECAPAKRRAGIANQQFLCSSYFSLEADNGDKGENFRGKTHDLSFMRAFGFGHARSY